VELEDLLQERMLVHVHAVDVDPQLALARLNDPPHPGRGERLLDDPVWAPVDAGGPMLGNLGLDDGLGHS